MNIIHMDIFIYIYKNFLCPHFAVASCVVVVVVVGTDNWPSANDFYTFFYCHWLLLISLSTCAIFYLFFIYFYLIIYVYISSTL